MSTKLRTFQTHENGDLLIRFELDWHSRDLELISMFGDPEVDVGGTFLGAAELTPTIDGSGTFTGVTVTNPGVAGTYSSYLSPTVVVTDPGGLGTGATFAVTVSGTGTISGVAVSAGGSGYDPDSTLTLTNDHVTIYPAHKVKLRAGFPFTRRINTVAAGDSSLAYLATAYATALRDRIDTALDALRALPTGGFDLTSETVFQP